MVHWKWARCLNSCTGKSDAECHGKDAYEKHTAALRKILLVQAKNPFEKIKDAYVR